MRILTDHNIAEALSLELELLGHDVRRVRDLIRPNTPDALIDYISARDGFVVVTHDKDFRDLPDSMPFGYRKRMQRAGRIVLEIPAPRAISRLRDVHDVIAFTEAWSRRENHVFRMQVTLTTIWIKDRNTPSGAAPTPTAPLMIQQKRKSSF